MELMKVLVVDDDDAIRDTLRLVLESEGCEVSVARNGREALELLLGRVGHEPDLVLLDLMMPVLDGWQFLEELRRSPRAMPRIVIMSAGHGGSRHAEELSCEYLAKPIALEALLDALSLRPARPAQKDLLTPAPACSRL
jgi:two-component system, chemotaxis family, chemotaxis protein CheY